MSLPVDTEILSSSKQHNLKERPKSVQCFILTWNHSWLKHSKADGRFLTYRTIRRGQMHVTVHWTQHNEALRSFEMLNFFQHYETLLLHFLCKLDFNSTHTRNFLSAAHNFKNISRDLVNLCQCKQKQNCLLTLDPAEGPSGGSSWLLGSCTWYRGQPSSQSLPLPSPV